MRTLHASTRTVSVMALSVVSLAAAAIGVAGQGEALPGDPAGPTGDAISEQVMEAWATNDAAAVEALYDPEVIMVIDADVVAADRDEIRSVIAGARGIGNTYRQHGPVIEYQDENGDLYVGTIVEVKGPGHPTGVPIVGFYRVRDGKVIRHVFMDAEHY